MEDLLSIPDIFEIIYGLNRLSDNTSLFLTCKSLKKLCRKEYFRPASLMCVDAAMDGNLAMVILGYDYGYPCEEAVFQTAAKYGQINIFEWAIQNSIDWRYKDLHLKAIEGSHTKKIYTWLYSHNYTYLNHLNHRKLSLACCRFGNLDFLKYLFEGKNPHYFRDNIERAIQYGHTHILQWLHDYFHIPVYTYNYVTAIQYDQLGVVEWLYKIGAPVFSHIPQLALTEILARKGNLRILQWCHINNISFDPNTCDIANKHKHFECVRWLQQNGHPWISNNYYGKAIAAADIDMLNWLYSEQFPFSGQQTFEDAIYTGDMEIIQWLHDHECPWNKTVFLNAVRIARLDILTWLHEKSCPWDKSKCLKLAQSLDDHRIIDFIDQLQQ